MSESLPSSFHDFWPRHAPRDAAPCERSARRTRRGVGVGMRRRSVAAALIGALWTLPPLPRPRAARAPRGGSRHRVGGARLGSSGSRSSSPTSSPAPRAGCPHLRALAREAGAGVPHVGLHIRLRRARRRAWKAPHAPPRAYLLAAEGGWRAAAATTVSRRWRARCSSSRPTMRRSPRSPPRAPPAGARRAARLGPARRAAAAKLRAELSALTSAPAIVYFSQNAGVRAMLSRRRSPTSSSSRRAVSLWARRRRTAWRRRRRAPRRRPRPRRAARRWATPAPARRRRLRRRPPPPGQPRPRRHARRCGRAMGDDHGAPAALGAAAPSAARRRRRRRRGAPPARARLGAVSWSHTHAAPRARPRARRVRVTLAVRAVRERVIRGLGDFLSVGDHSSEALPPSDSDSLARNQHQLSSSQTKTSLSSSKSLVVQLVQQLVHHRERHRLLILALMPPSM